jgi:hypothetical protein
MTRGGFWRRAGLVACLALAALWVTSIFTTVGWSNYSGSTGIRCVAATRGCLDLVWDGDFTGGRLEWIATTAPPGGATVWWPQYDRPGLVVPYSILLIPWWMPLALAAVPTAWVWWRRLRAGPTACRACGYELAGLPRGSRCPECGR